MRTRSLQRGGPRSRWGALVLLAAAMTAASAGGLVPGAARANALDGVRRVSPDERERRLADRETKREAVARHRQRLLDEATLSPVDRTEALSCGMPCDSGVLAADNVFHDVLVDCATGTFGVRTGASHPATIDFGSKLDLLFDAAAGNASGGRVALFAHDESLLLDPPGGRQACVFDPPDTADEPGSLGIEQEWTVTVRPGLDLAVRHELVAFGSGPSNAGVRSTVSVTNLSDAESAVLGLRWWLDPTFALDDGPVVTAVNCDPYEEVSQWTEEHELAPAEIAEHLQLVNDDVFGTEPTIEMLVSTSAVAGFPSTAAPDRVVTARWSNAPDSPAPPWDYMPFEGDPTGDDVVLLLSHGHAMADAIGLPPAETLSLSTVLLAACDRAGGGCVPPSLSAAAVPAMACPGDTIVFTGEELAPGVGDYVYTWTFGDGSRPVEVSDPTVPVMHVYEAPDFYRARLTASDGTDPGCTSPFDVDVDVVVGPAPTGELTDELRVTRPSATDVRLAWPGSTVDPPAFVAFRTDDLASVPVRARWVDATRVDSGPEETADDVGSVGSGPVRFYLVLPADPTCFHPIIPPDRREFREVLRDEMEEDSGWIVDPDGTDMATTGLWVRGDPNGTAHQVEDDQTPDPGTDAWVTGNLAGAGDGEDDVDDGCTTLQSPVYDLAGREGVRLSYWRAWTIAAAMDDVFLVEISNDGGMSWMELETIDVPTGGFRQASFFLESALGEPPDRVVLRFNACDQGAGSFLEAAVDDLVIEEIF